MNKPQIATSRALRIVVVVLWFVVAAPWPSGLQAGTAPAPATGPLVLDSGTFQRPPWLTVVSLGVKESFDDNVYLAGPGQPASFTLPAGRVAALKDISSWVTTISPKIGVDLAPLLEDSKTLQTASFTYAPDFAIYHDQTAESNEAHRFATAVKGGVDHLSISLENGFTYVHGSPSAPFYPGGFLSAWGIVPPRERREQIQDRATVAIQYDLDQWFIRPCASLLYYDMMTELQNTSGYLNFSDRSDVNGGTDFGYRITPALAVTAGYRYGHQAQQQFSFSPYSSPCDYQRALFGLEGKPWKWLDVRFQGGPDFRNYAGNTAAHVTPVNDPHSITWYGEGALAATLTGKDTVTVKYREFRWESCLGKVPYVDAGYELGYRRKLTGKLVLDLGGKLSSADYTVGNLATCQRVDLQYSLSAGLGYTFSSHVSAALNYTRDLGRNAQDGVVNPQTREYDRDLVSLGAVVKF